jgi:signal transduction histidine kinase
MTETETGEKSAEIMIADSGPGIAEAHREKVLQPFFTTKEEGTGLGLSIAVRIVEQHGGTLSVLSKEGEGATFTITLPIKEKAFEHNPHN